MDLRKFIRDVPDFPTPGILFKDITPLLKDPQAFGYVIDSFSEIVKAKKPTVIAAVESRGFIFAAPLANKLSLPFVPIRKPGKLPHEAISIEYSLEYGQGKLEMHKDALTGQDRVVLIDDLLATGGTAMGSIQLIEKLGATITDLLFVIELAFLNGRKNLHGFEVHSLLTYA